MKTGFYDEQNGVLDDLEQELQDIDDELEMLFELERGN